MSEKPEAPIAEQFAHGDDVQITRIDGTVDELVARVTAQIEGQNWTDQPLTEQEKTVIDMAVRATVHANTKARVLSVQRLGGNAGHTILLKVIEP